MEAGATLFSILVAVSFAAPPTHAPPRRQQAHHARPHAKPAKKRTAPPAVVYDPNVANDPTMIPFLWGRAAGSSVLRAQVLLDRAHFSPGEIDGTYGDNTRRAVNAFNAVRGLPGCENVTPETWAALNRDEGPVVVPYEVTADDVAGPFEPNPTKMEDKARLGSMAYSSAQEELAERFHMSPSLLAALNRSKKIEKGARLQVLDVSRPSLTPIARLTVSGSDLSVTAFDLGGAPVARYPATVGSEHDPLPVGEWKIVGVGKNPLFHYNPELFWDADPKDTKVTVPAGPNNPVGVVWIDLSKTHYGIHGSPEPQQVGKTTSHGCIRLTNWDAAELASLVRPGVPAVLQQ